MRVVDEATRRKWRHVPNAISWARLVLGAVVLTALVVRPEWLHDPWMSGWSALAIAVVYVTDFVDGYIARRFDVTSKFGAVLDTLVDKAVVVAPVFWLAFVGAISNYYVLGWIVAVLTFVREVVAALGKRIAERKGVELKVQESGRFKMAAQCLAIILTIWTATRGEVSLLFFGGAVFLSFYSLYDYWLTFHRTREVEAA